MTLFELHWQGGAAERRFRKLRPGAPSLPWHALTAADHQPALVARARLAWTQGAFNEHCTAAAMAALLQVLLAANAPIDLVGMAGDFIADEMNHVELNARMAMVLGGAPLCEVDFSSQVPQVKPAPPLMRACELALRVCCVAETFSAPILAATAKAATHPLTRAVLEQLARDEPHHAMLGWLVLQWGLPQLSQDERQRLADAADEEIRLLWSEQAQYYGDADGTEPSDAEVCALGWLPAEQHAELTRQVLHHDIAKRLRSIGVPSGWCGR